MSYSLTATTVHSDELYWLNEFDILWYKALTWITVGSAPFVLMVRVLWNLSCRIIDEVWDPVFQHQCNATWTREEDEAEKLILHKQAGKKKIIIIKMWSWLVLHVSTLSSVPTTAGGGKVLKSVTCCCIQVSLNRPSLDGTAEFSENTHALLHPLRTAKLHRHSGRWRWDLHSPSVCLVWLLRKSFHARPVIDSSHVMLTQFWSKLVWPEVCTATTQQFNMVHTPPRPLVPPGGPAPYLRSTDIKYVQIHMNKYIVFKVNV